MPKSSGAKRKAKNAGVGIDFKKAKHRVGKKLPKAQNSTDTNFKSKAISLPGQNVGEDKGAAVTQGNLTLKELLVKSGHYSEKMRLEAMQGLMELFTSHPEGLRKQTGPVIEKLANRIADSDKQVRAALKELLAGSLLPQLGEGRLTPFLPLLMAHICSAMTHLQAGIRTDGMGFLELVMDAAPQQVSAEYVAPALQHYADLLSPASRSRTIASHSLSSLLKTLTSLESFLKKSANKATAKDQDIDSTKGNEGAGLAAEALFACRCAWVPISAVARASRAVAQLAGQEKDLGTQTATSRATYSQLMTNLGEAWGECAPSILGEAYELDAVLAMEACLQSMRLLLQQDAFTKNPEAASGARSAVLQRLGGHLPLKAPTVRCSPAMQQALMRLNLAGMQLLTSFLDDTWQGREATWMVRLLEYYASVLERGEVLPPQGEFADDVQQPTVPSEVYSTILAGTQKVLLYVAPSWRRQLLAGVTALARRTPSKSPTQVACLRFMQAVFAQPGLYLVPDASGEPPVLETEAATWLQGLPKLLWEAGGSRPVTSRLALIIMLDAARFCQPDGQVAAQLASLQPSLAPFYCMERLGPGKSPGNQRGHCGPSVVSQLGKLPLEMQTLALDLLHYLPTTDAAILKAITLLCSSQALPPDMQRRAIDNLAVRGTAGGAAEGERLRAFLLGLVVDPWLQPCSTRDDYALLDCAATALAGLPSGEGPTGSILHQEEPRLLAACSSGSPDRSCLGVVAAVSAVSRLHHPSPGSTTAAASSEEGVPLAGGGEPLGAGHLPQQLQGILPGVLAKAALDLCPEGGGFGRSWIRGMTSGLLICHPQLLGPLLTQLPLAAAGSSSVSHGKIASAAEAILSLCEGSTTLPLFAKAQGELKQAHADLRDLAERIGKESEAGRHCHASVKRLGTTVNNLLGVGMANLQA